jgi:hypothetical protein
LAELVGVARTPRFPVFGVSASVGSDESLGEVSPRLGARLLSSFSDFLMEMMSGNFSTFLTTALSETVFSGFLVESCGLLIFLADLSPDSRYSEKNIPAIWNIIYNKNFGELFSWPMQYLPALIEKQIAKSLIFEWFSSRIYLNWNSLTYF